MAVGLAVLALRLGWRGGDLPASLYRVGLFQRNGLAMWDSQWYGGHWTFGYSVIFPPIAGLAGVGLTAVACAGLASLSFDRIVVAHFGVAARSGSVLFAVGTVEQIAIGQLPFMMGEALALAGCWAASRRRWVVAAVLGAGASLASPMAGAFLALAIVAWLISGRRQNWRGLCLFVCAVIAPAAAMGVLFPGRGSFPYPARDFVAEFLGCAALWFLIPRREVVLRRAVLLYAVVIAGSATFRNPVGSNIARLGECLAVPVLVCLLWPHRRRLVALLIVPLGLWQWTPAWAAITQDGKDPSTHQVYYDALDHFLASHATPAGRVEVVPTKLHWEVVYVAPVVPLARGWERQLDTAANPLFYSTDAFALTAETYRSWLIANGVRFVAISDAPADYAAKAEADLVRSGIPGLEPVWTDAHWTVFQVVASPGLVDGPATLTNVDGGRIDLHISGPGRVVLRVRFNQRWSVIAGAGCLAPTADGWTAVTAAPDSDLRLQLRLLPQTTECFSPS